ncbi:MAG: ABC transporter permease, partial [Chloroflexota bacterium]
MTRFIIRRLIFTIILLFALTAFIFVISEIAPISIATNVLGGNITNEQIAAFNAQNGLDQPPLTRYLRWLLGSDHQAEDLIGQPITRIYEPQTDRYKWWILDKDGTLYQTRSRDGENILRLERQADGRVKEVPAADDVWQLGPDGRLVYWGIDRNNRAAMWVKGDTEERLLRTELGWQAVVGAPQAFIPLKYGILRGDPGVSFKSFISIGLILQRRLLNSLWLAFLSIGAIMPLALGLGLVAGLYQGSYLDRFLTIFSVIATATPEFVSGIFLILVFSAWLGWFPGAVVLTNDTAIFTQPKLLVLPILTLMCTATTEDTVWDTSTTSAKLSCAHHCSHCCPPSCNQGQTLLPSV